MEKQITHKGYNLTCIGFNDDGFEIETILLRVDNIEIDLTSLLEDEIDEIENNINNNYYD